MAFANCLHTPFSSRLRHQMNSVPFHSAPTAKPSLDGPRVWNISPLPSPRPCKLSCLAHVLKTFSSEYGFYGASSHRERLRKKGAHWPHASPWPNKARLQCQKVGDTWDEENPAGQSANLVNLLWVPFLICQVWHHHTYPGYYNDWIWHRESLRCREKSTPASTLPQVAFPTPAYAL